MKKLLLFNCLLCLSTGAFAQTLTLTGPSYIQNFNTIGSSMPTGWRVYNGSGASSIGALETLATSSTTGVFRDTSCGATNVTSGGFKNYASANAVTEGTPCSVQQTTTDRALGVRQVSKTNIAHPNLDSGAAFVLVLTNTASMYNFNLQFKLQSLDTSSPRVTKWMVDYAIGSPTSFTPVTTVPANPTTGGNTFSNTNVTVNFGTAFDNKSSNIYIRVVTLGASTGSGNRASTAIDDFQLTYYSPVGIKNINEVDGAAFNQLGIGTSSAINFNFNTIDAGEYTLSMTDMTGRMIHSEKLNIVNGDNNISVMNANLPSGMYVARLTNGTTNGIVKVVVQ